MALLAYGNCFAVDVKQPMWIVCTTCLWASVIRSSLIDRHEWNLILQYQNEVDLLVSYLPVSLSWQEFVVQHSENANPPTFFLTMEMLLEKMQSQDSVVRMLTITRYNPL